MVSEDDLLLGFTARIYLLLGFIYCSDLLLGFIAHSARQNHVQIIQAVQWQLGQSGSHVILHVAALDGGVGHGRCDPHEFWMVCRQIGSPLAFYCAFLLSTVHELDA